MSEQKSLFDDLGLWGGMPEFVQEKQKPYAEMKLRFRSEEDLQEFAKMIGQKLTVKTRSVWHPPLVRGAVNGSKRWIDGEE